MQRQKVVACTLKLLPKNGSPKLEKSVSFYQAKTVSTLSSGHITNHIVDHGSNTSSKRSYVWSVFLG